MLLFLNPKDALDTGVMDTGDWRGMFALYAQEWAERWMAFPIVLS